MTFKWPTWGKKNPPEDETVRSELTRTKIELLALQGAIKTEREVSDGLRKKLSRYENRIDVDYMIGDVSPVDKEKRRLYVSAVAGLGKDYLIPKLKLMIAATRKLMDNADNSRDQDQSLKGASYAFQEFIRWFELMLSEDAAYMAGQHTDTADKK